MSYCRKLIIFPITFTLLIAGCSENGKNSEPPENLLIMEDIGGYSFPITTESANTQQLFNQGMTLAYGFNHKEAFKSFEAATKIDPTAAMAYWGQAYVLGPNINLPMDPENEAIAFGLVEQAEKQSGHLTEKEKDLINALKKRYSSSKIDDRSELDKQWALETERLVEKYPDDPDIATLHAESLMLLRPWNYWTKDKKPYPETTKTINALEKAIDNHPKHFGALHFYIHIMEASNTPKKAEKAADTLRELNIQTGHLLHMPAHIYMRIGRYDDAIEVNKLAVTADENYIKKTQAEGAYPAIYYPHNTHFLVWAYMIQGRKQEAIEGATKIASSAKPEEIQTKTFLNSFAVVPYYVLVRFGMWDEILELPEPEKDLKYVRAIWLFSQGMALAETGKVEEAKKALDELKSIAENPEVQSLMLLSHNTAGPILQIAALALSAEIEMSQGNTEKAMKHYQETIRLEDELSYNEPPDWMIPSRQSMGQAKLMMNEPRDAEILFLEDLGRHPASGWALMGLYQSLLKQGKNEEAAKVKEELDRAWSKAEIHDN